MQVYKTLIQNQKLQSNVLVQMYFAGKQPIPAINEPFSLRPSQRIQVTPLERQPVNICILLRKDSFNILSP